MRKKKDEQIIEKDKSIAMKDDELVQLREDYLELLQQVAKKNINEDTEFSTPVLNANFVINNFKNPKDFSKIMKKPLTHKEIKMIKDKGPIDALSY